MIICINTHAKTHLPGEHKKTNILPSIAERFIAKHNSSFLNDMQVNVINHLPTLISLRKTS